MTTRTLRHPALRGPMAWNRSSSPRLGVAPLVLVAGKALLPVAATAASIIVGGVLLKDQLDIDTSKIPPAAILGGAGAAAFYASDFMPDKWKIVGMLVGIGGVVGSLVVLFTPGRGSPSQQPPPVPPKIMPDPGTQIPNLRLGPLTESLQVILDGAQKRTGGVLRNAFLDQEFEFIVRNNYSRKVEAWAGLAVYTKGGELYWKTGSTFPVNDPTYGRKYVEVPAGGNADQRLTMPSINFDWLLKWHNFDVQVELFSTLNAGTPVLTSMAIPIAFGAIG